MKLIMDFEDYQPWSGAVYTYDLIDAHNKLDELAELITQCYPEGLTETKLNDLLWFEPTWVLSSLEIEDDDNDELE